MFIHKIVKCLEIRLASISKSFDFRINSPNSAAESLGLPPPPPRLHPLASHRGLFASLFLLHDEHTTQLDITPTSIMKCAAAIALMMASANAFVPSAPLAKLTASRTSSSR